MLKWILIFIMLVIRLVKEVLFVFSPMFPHSRVFSFNMAFFVEIIYIYVIQIFLPDSINHYLLDIFWLFSSVIDCPMKLLQIQIQIMFIKIILYSMLTAEVFIT